MTDFFKKSKTVNVSRISKEGWWLGNTTEHVVKGTALGEDFTKNIYTPSSSGMIARYDRFDDTWSNEVKDMTWEVYWDKNGHNFVIGQPNGSYPDWAVKEVPPEYDDKTQTVLYVDGQGWRIHPILIGVPFYDAWGNEFLVSDYNFELPENHTWVSPPKPKDGHVIKFIESKWVEIIDHRGKTAFAKNRDDSDQVNYRIESLGEIPDTHTLLEPGIYDSWISGGWVYDIDRHTPEKEVEERTWRTSELSKVLNRIDQYEKDQNYPEELRTSPIQSHNDFLLLLNDRKVLSDYPSASGFPFGERPTLSGLAE